MSLVTTKFEKLLPVYDVSVRRNSSFAFHIVGVLSNNGYLEMARHEESPSRHPKGISSRGRVAPFDNPCEKEQDLSYKCLHENGFDKDKCSIAFANYQACKDFWTKVRAERRAKGIYPYMPSPEDRKIILDKYRNQKS